MHLVRTIGQPQRARTAIHRLQRQVGRYALCAEYLDRYTAEKNHEILMDVYRRALARWER